MWIHGIVADKDDHNQNNRLYKKYLTEIGWLITRNS